MKDFKRGNHFGGGQRNNNFKKRSFGDTSGPRDFGGGHGGGFSGSKEMHQATCADCGKTCEVPFRPNGKKPVFCKDCFSNSRDQNQDHSFSRSPSFSKDTYRPEKKIEQIGILELKKSLESLHNKIESLTLLVGTLSVAPKSTSKKIVAEKKENPVVKKIVKKALKKPAKRVSKK